VLIADFHIHSKYSIATSRNMDVETIADHAAVKGVHLIGTGDFTHPLWLGEHKRKLKPAGKGIYKYKRTLFIITGEISTIYSKKGRTRRVHNLVFVPSLECAEAVSKMLGKIGTVSSDGRPIFGMDCETLAARLFDITPDIVIVPAHVWTPHFGVFGSESGFDSLEECYGKYADRIFAVETGLSSDPSMNWRWSYLDRLSLISNSDAHSPSKIGREANVFDKPFDYFELMDILKRKDAGRFLFTIEFYPEEGKYHWDGHRACKAALRPEDSKRVQNKCPKCGKPVTVGVLHRVEEMADRKEGFVLKKAPAFKKLIPLIEIISAALDIGTGTKGAKKEYDRLISNFGTEFDILLNITRKELDKVCGELVSEGIMNAREGKVKIAPGYDGEYGVISFLGKGIRKGF